MFSIITIASSTTKPVAIVKRHQRQVVELKPSRYITASVPTSDSGTDEARDQGRRDVGAETGRSRGTTSATESASSNCTSRTDARIVVVRSVTMRYVERGGQRRAAGCGSSAS